jgi:hypothetical protein
MEMEKVVFITGDEQFRHEVEAGCWTMPAELRQHILQAMPEAEIIISFDEHLLNRIRLAVYRGKRTPDSVLILDKKDLGQDVNWPILGWNAIEIDRKGTLTEWPKHFTCECEYCLAQCMILLGIEEEPEEHHYCDCC